MSKIDREQLKQDWKDGMTIKDMSLKYKVNTRTIERARAKLVASGFDPQSDRYHNYPDDQAVKGYSTLVRVKDKEDGSTGTVMEWVKTSRTIDQLYDSLNHAIASLTDPIPVDLIPQTKQKNKDTDIIPWFNIGDGHLGMVAYSKEIGTNFDLDIAERDLCAAMSIKIDRAGDHHRCVIQDMGDMTHYENFSAKTEGSGHDLDFDTRYPKMIKTYIRTMHFIINKALEKFEKVDVIINQGNHSRTNDIWMAHHLRALYGNTDRVNVLDNECVFIPYRMGNTFVMCHHSDKCRPPRLAQVMSTDFRHDWGETEYHYIDIGHIHHHMVSKEHPGCKIESFNQMATSDKYAHDGGWRSRSCLTVIYRSKTYGEVGRETLTLEEVRDILESAPAGTNSNKRREVYRV